MLLWDCKMCWSNSVPRCRRIIWYGCFACGEVKKFW